MITGAGGFASEVANGLALSPTAFAHARTAALRSGAILDPASFDYDAFVATTNHNRGMLGVVGDGVIGAIGITGARYAPKAVSAGRGLVTRLFDRVASAFGRGKSGAPASWGNPATFADHFLRHGKDFGAKSADDYARQAAEFLERAKLERFPTKVDVDGIIRVYDPKTNTFGAFNPDGTTRTFFKPTSSTFFDRQPGI